MLNLHHHFDQLSEREQERIGDAYRAMTAELGHDLHIDGDDTAERIVDAIAAGILASRESNAKRQAEREDNRKFAEFIKRLVQVADPRD